MTPDDDLLPLLAPQPHEDAALRAAILAASAGPIRRRAWARRAGRLGVVAAVAALSFAAGRNSVGVPEPVAAVEVPPTEVEVAPEPRPAASPPEAEPTAERYELKAELADDPAEAAAYYRLAGDAFLRSRADVAQAARCYRLHLAAAGPAGRAIAATDSWLLMALKN